MAYLPLSTANLPDPAIDPAQGKEPTDYFNTVLYTGTGSAQDITGVGFEPDFTWLKIRSSADNHILYDRLRGTGVLYSNSTASERDDTSTDDFTFDSDGFAFTGGWNNINGSGSTYVGWNWKANGSGVSNTDGSITSTVSANTESGFSVITWTGNGTNGASVGHGLNQTPDLYIIKNRDAAETWWVSGYPQLSSVFSTAYKFLSLESTNALSTAGGTATTATSTTIEFTDSGAATNEGSSDMVCYAFHSVEGFSKFSSYVGNGSADGPFVYTGFRPAFVMVKRTDTSEDWWIKDSVRGQYNPDDFNLFPNSSNAESTSNSGRYVDLLSNGFKPRGTNFGVNASGGTYIYMAFAENPFKYSNAR